MKIEFLGACIDTPRLWLLSCDKSVLLAFQEGENALAEYLGVQLPPNWTGEREALVQMSLTMIDNPAHDGWFMHLPILKEENLLVGTCGYTGAPTPEGMVEIGYEVAEAYRNRGLAREMAQALIDKARTFPEVKTVQAHTLPEHNTSTRILQRCGMQFVGPVEDPTDGLVWKWKCEL